MKIIQLTEKNHSLRNKFCISSNDAWFWHTTQWMKYSIKHTPQLEGRNVSFLISDGNRVLGIFPLIVETNGMGQDKVHEFSFGGSFGVSPALSNELSHTKRNKIMRMMFDHADDIASEYNIQRMSIKSSVLSPNFCGSKFANSNWLLRYGFIDTSLNTQLLDLSNNVTILWKGMRRDLRKNIEREKQKLTVEVMDRNNADFGVFDIYREMHALAAGRVTRPLETFDVMFEWIQTGKAILFGAKYEGQFVGFFFVTVYKNGAYNGSSCRHPEFHEMSIGHYLRWEIVKWLKNHNIVYNEIGVQKYSALPYDLPSAKEINISKAKSGLGGFIVPLFRGEKYYSTEYFIKVHTQRMEDYAAKLSDMDVKK